MFVGIFSHDDASRMEVTQLGKSACGATAIVNALLALDLVTPTEVSNVDWSLCILRKRDLDCPLPEYLISRSLAGCTGSDLVQSMNILSSSIKSKLSVCGEFIPYQSIGKDVVEFIAELLSRKISVIGTFNLQILGNDAWHHQMIYGVDKSTRMIHCTNPICAYPAELVVRFLSTESTLLVRREDVIPRISRTGGDESIYQQPLWRQCKVAEQIAVMSADDSITHLVIPASYVGGLSTFQIIKDC